MRDELNIYIITEIEYGEKFYATKAFPTEIEIDDDWVWRISEENLLFLDESGDLHIRLSNGYAHYNYIGQVGYINQRSQWTLVYGYLL